MKNFQTPTTTITGKEKVSDDLLPSLLVAVTGTACSLYYQREVRIPYGDVAFAREIAIRRARKANRLYISVVVSTTKKESPWDWGAEFTCDMKEGGEYLFELET